MAYIPLFSQEKKQPVKTTGGYQPLFVDTPKITFTEEEKKKELNKYMRKLVRGEKVKGLIKSQSIVPTKPITVPPRKEQSGFVSRLKEGFKMPFKKFFEPIPDKVRARDFIREIPTAYEDVGKAIFNFGRTIQQEIARSGASTALTMSEATTGGAKELDISGKEIENKIARIIFGDRPLKSIESRIADAELSVIDFGRKRQKSQSEFVRSVGKYSEENALGMSIFGVGAMITLDFTGAGGQKNAIKLISKSKNIPFISKLLRQINVAEDLIPATAKKMASITDEKTILNAINKIDDLQKSTKMIKEGLEQSVKAVKEAKPITKAIPDELIGLAQKAKKYKNAEDFRLNSLLELEKNKKALDYIVDIERKTGTGWDAKTFYTQATKAVKEVGGEVAGKIPKKIIPKIAKTVPERITEMKKFATEPTALKATKAKSIIREKGLKEFKSFEIPEETFLRKLQTKIQDKMTRLNIIQRSIKKSGKTISEEADAYLKAELYIGKASSKIDDFDKNIISPILKKLKTAKVDADEFGAYLYAKHAPERNAQIAKLGKLTSGSGMTGKQADDVIRVFEKKGNLKEVEKIAVEFYENITKKRLKILKESGLLSDDTVKKLQATYKNYVPLKGKAGVERLDPLGQGFSIAGKDVKRAFGRESRAENPFVRAILDYQTTIIRAEKNKAAKTFLKLVKENPNPKLWNVESLKYRPHFNKVGELISLDPKFKFADNIMQVRVDGKIKLITIDDPTLAKAMKNLGQEKSIKILYTLNNYLRSVNTVMNPEFILTNFERDLQTALINVGGEQSLKMGKNTAKNIPKAMRGIWRNIRKGDTTSEWGKIYQELKTEGGKTGFFDYKSVEQKTNELLRRIKLYNTHRVDKMMSNAIRGVGDYINNVNEVVEMAVRTSAYNEALKNGFSKARAASLAKNLTVNFNTKGNWGTMLNTLYLFSNAGIQGSTRIIRALKHKNVRKIVAGITVGSFGLNEMNRAINEEEYNKIQDWEKNSNLIFMLPNGNHLNIRLPYGFNIFKILGDISNEIVHQNITIGESFKRLLIALDDAYNPLSSGTLAQLLSPTLTDPIVQIGENKNWFGGPIKPEQPTFGAKKRESKLYWSSVRTQTKAITEWLNKITGGSEIEAGFIDVSPENIDHLFDFMTGGVGKFVSNSLTSTIDIGKGEFPELKNIPFARQVIKEPSEFYASGIIRKVLDKSGIGELSKKEIDKFRASLKDRLKKEEIDAETATRMIKDLMRNQAKIKAGRIFTEIKNASKKEKIKAMSELNELEKKEFIKILKKQ